MSVIEKHEAMIQAKIDEKIAAGGQADIDKLDAEMAVDAVEHFDYQQLQAQCHAAGILPTADAQMVYMALGEVPNDGNGGWAPGVTTARKVTITQLMLELVRWRMSGLVQA